MSLDARDIVLAKGRCRILDGAGARLARGEVVGLIGPNGAGKTSLLRAMAGIERPSAGTVTIDGQDVRTLPRRHAARLLGYLAQGAVCHWPLTVERLVALGRLPHLGPWDRPAARDDEAIVSAMAETDILHLRGRVVTSLSGGERARVLLARALAGEPALLLADEPVAGLDPGHQLQIMGLFRRLAGQGRGILVVLHDLTLAARFCNRLVVVHEGRIAAEGPPDAVLTPALLARVYAIRARFDAEGRSVVPWDVVQ